MKEKKLPMLFIVVLGALSISNILIPSKSFSSKENRYLQQIPKLTYDNVVSNKFSAEFELYASDQFIWRDKWIGLKTLSERAILKQDNGRVYFGKNGYLFDIQTKLNKDQFDLNIKNINRFVENLKVSSKDIVIKALMVPTKTEVLKDMLPLSASVLDESLLLNDIEKVLSNKINIISLIDKLKFHNNESIYYKTDHHWTTLGAYYGYQQLLEKDAYPINDFLIEDVSEDFLGTSYRKSNFYLNVPDTIERFNFKNEPQLKITINEKDVVTSLYMENYLNKTDKYSYFMGGDHAIVEINTSVKNNKSVLILKDSFANSMIPFLVNHYENIYVVDTRYYNGSIINLIEKYLVNEVLMIYNIQTFVNETTLSKLNNK